MNMIDPMNNYQRVKVTYVCILYTNNTDPSLQSSEIDELSKMLAMMRASEKESSKFELRKH